MSSVETIDDQVARLNASGYNYYLWLLGKIKLHEQEQYRKLVDQLFDTEFFWVLDYDSNRASNGLYLRYLFEMETGYPISEYKEVGLNVPCSVLEALIALAMDIENKIMYEADLGDRTDIWFWMMLDNLSLSKATNDQFEFDGIFGPVHVDCVLSNWLERSFNFDGTGSPFPLKNASEDQRNVDIWGQVSAYFNEILELNF